MGGDELSARYQKAGFGGLLRWGSRPALVVVDFTNGFTDPSQPTGADMTQAMQATDHLIRAAHAVDAPVVFTTIAYGSLDEGGTWLVKAPGMAALRAGTELVEVDSRLSRDEADVLIVKKSASAFFGTSLTTTLTSRKVDTVIVCGATTSGCVRATVVDAVSHGWVTVVPRQCVADRAAGPHEASLFDMNQKYADVVSDQDVVEYLKNLPRELGR